MVSDFGGHAKNSIIELKSLTAVSNNMVKCHAGLTSAGRESLLCPFFILSGIHDIAASEAGIILTSKSCPLP
jgi:hypothetical protein